MVKNVPEIVLNRDEILSFNHMRLLMLFVVVVVVVVIVVVVNVVVVLLLLLLLLPVTFHPNSFGYFFFHFQVI